MTREQREIEWRKNPIVKKLMDICPRYGYECYRACIESWGGLSLQIVPKDRSFHSFYPDIYHNWNTRDLRDMEYKISTISYGSLTAPEFEKMLHCRTEALNLVKELELLDMSKLPVLPDNFEDYEPA